MAAVAAVHDSGTRGTSCSQIHTCLMLWPFFTPRPRAQGKKKQKLPSGYLRPFTRKSYGCFIPAILYVSPPQPLLRNANIMPSFSIYSFFCFFYHSHILYYVIFSCMFVALIIYIYYQFITLHVTWVYIIFIQKLLFLIR